MFWWVTGKGQNDAIISGSTPLTLEGVRAGLRLEFTGAIDLSGMDTEFLQEQAVLKMRFEGRDIAGNQFERAVTGAFPAGVWNLIHYTPDFSLEQSGIELSKSNLEVDEPTIVQVHVRNDGMLGRCRSTSRSCRLVWSTYPIEQIVNICGASQSHIGSRLAPDAPGMQRIEVTLSETTDKSEFIDVKPTKERGFLEDAIGSTNPWILGTTMTMICIGLLFVLSWMRVATAKQGESELEWELDEEFDED